MRPFQAVVVVALGCAAAWGSDWLTDGKDPQRTNWQKDEKIVTTANAKNIKLLWKLKLDNEPRQMHSLFPMLIAENVNTSNGPKEIGIATGVSDNIFAIDVALGKVHPGGARCHGDVTAGTDEHGHGRGLHQPRGLVFELSCSDFGRPQLQDRRPGRGAQTRLGFGDDGHRYGPRQLGRDTPSVGELGLASPRFGIRPAR